MRKLLPLAFAALMTFLLAFSFVSFENVPLPARHPAEWTVMVIGPDGTGSGIPVKQTPEGFTIVLTAKHVAERITPPEGFVRSGEVTLPITRVELHPDMDVAAIWVQERLPTVEIDYEPVQFADEVEGAGWVFGSFLNLTRGLVARHGNVSMDSYPGCSGGPVFRRHRLVGIIVASMRVGGLPVGGPSDFVQLSKAESWLRGIL